MIRWGEALPTEISEIRDTYRSTFTTAAGRTCLMYMLTDLGFFDQTSDEVSQALRNYAVRLLEQMGILHETNMESMVKGLLNLAPYDMDLHKQILKQEEDDD